MRIIVSAASFAEPSAANDNEMLASPRFRETYSEAAARLLAAMDGRRNGGGANVTRSPAAVPHLRAVE